MAARTPNSKFAAPFKSPSMCSSLASSQSSDVPQPLHGTTSRRGESRNLLPPPADQQQHQKPRGKDILSGLSQDSNISQSVKLFVTPTIRSPVAKQSAPTGAKASGTRKRNKVSNKEYSNDDLSHCDVRPIREANIRNLPQSIRIEPAAKSKQYRRDKSTKSKTTKVAESIRPTNQEAAAKQTEGHSTRDTHVKPGVTNEGKRHSVKVASSADTEQKPRDQDVYKFPLSPNSLQKQRQRIRKRQTRDTTKWKLLALIARMHTEMQDLRERHRIRLAAKEKGSDKLAAVAYTKSTIGSRKTPTVALVQASTACTTITINKQYKLKRSGSVQKALLGFTERGPDRKRISAVEQ